MIAGVNGGEVNVASVVGIDKGRRKARGLVRLEVNGSVQVMQRAEASEIRDSLSAAIIAAGKDEVEAQAALDAGKDLRDIGEVVAEKHA